MGRVYLPEDVYAELVRYAEERYGRARGFLSLAAAELIRAGLAAVQGLREGGSPAGLEGRVERLERLVEEVAAAVTGLEGSLSQLREELGRLGEKVAALEGSGRGATGGGSGARRSGGRGRGAIEILREQGFSTEWELQGRVASPRTVLARLVREGALLIKTPSGFIAVHPGFWSSFAARLREKGDGGLRGRMRELLATLSHEGVARRTEKGWELPSPLSGGAALAALGEGGSAGQVGGG
ncbi:MAG: hypothetical protein QXT37_11255 [Thermofilaceae archaeon]